MNRDKHKYNINTGDVKAETLISRMDQEKDFNVDMQSVFYRNYSGDLMRYPPKDQTIQLSRDGIFDLLPEGLFFEEDRIEKILGDGFGKKYEIFKEEVRKIKLFFQPFDKRYFELSLELEENLNAVVEQGNAVFTNAFLDETETIANNDYIFQIKKLLPFVSHLRGNLLLLTDILKNILSAEKITIRKIKPFHSRFIIHQKGLSQKEYLFMMDEKGDLRIFFDFFAEWFLPVEVKYDYQIKDDKMPYELEKDRLILDYNTRL